MIVEVVLGEDVMTPNEIKEMISKCKTELDKINSIIKNLQKSCKHKETDLKFISEGIMNLRKVCNSCGKEVGYPTNEDLKKGGYY